VKAVDNSLLKALRPTYANINPASISNNIRLAKELSHSDIIAIVKADGYGHGAKETALTASKAGVSYFGVATVSEGISLRHEIKNGTNIIILGYVDPLYYDEIYKSSLIVNIYNDHIGRSYHEFLERRGARSAVSLKLDTGMARLGYPITLDFEDFKKRYPLFDVVHVMSHLSSSDSDMEYSAWQEEKFKEFIDRYNIQSASLYNSSAIAKYENRYKFTRPGLFLYGYVGGAEVAGLKPAMAIFSKIVHAAKYKKGDSVSYNRSYIAEREIWAGVVPIGYADGYRREFSNTARMYADGHYLPVIGKVCMDMAVVDVTCFGESAAGRSVEILGDHITAAELARLANTIEYEILCGISDRVPRVYEVV
jgi:alanine racemase